MLFSSCRKLMRFEKRPDFRKCFAFGWRGIFRVRWTPHRLSQLVGGEPELRLEAEGRWVTIVVIDNGIGVPAELRKEIFERFVRVEGPHRGLAGGHGLGLAQVRSVARGHGGRVVCTEGTDGGACFTLRLPAIR